VKKFQKSLDIPVTGNLDSRTIKELNGPPRGHQTDIVIANMERWRSYPRDLGKTHVIVNPPEFMLRVYNEGAQLDHSGWFASRQRCRSEIMASTTNNRPERRRRSSTNICRRCSRSDGVGAYDFRRPHRDGSVHLWPLARPTRRPNPLQLNRFRSSARRTKTQRRNCARTATYVVLDPAKMLRFCPHRASEQNHRTGWTGMAPPSDIQPLRRPGHLTTEMFVDDNGKQFFRDVTTFDSRTIAAIQSERHDRSERGAQEGRPDGLLQLGQRALTPPRNFPGAAGGGQGFSPQRCRRAALR
jgi:hypothetical protein